eukprot:758169-Hanusia_phi.AAC.3
MDGITRIYPCTRSEGCDDFATRGWETQLTTDSRSSSLTSKRKKKCISSAIVSRSTIHRPSSCLRPVSKQIGVGTGGKYRREEVSKEKESQRLKEEHCNLAFPVDTSWQSVPYPESAFPDALDSLDSCSAKAFPLKSARVDTMQTVPPDSQALQYGGPLAQRSYRDLRHGCHPRMSSVSLQGCILVLENIGLLFSILSWILFIPHC